jgi:prepilin-type N-terminal cleavage/methylation domain-containing protein
MEQRLTRRFNNSRSRGLTLIEVVASLALLGTLLVTILMARQRYTRQWNLAVSKAEAVDVADQMLTQWWNNPQTLPHEGRGDVAGHSDLTWRTRTINSQEADALNARIVRLEVLPRSTPQGRAGRAQDMPLAVVDILLPKPEEPGDEP